MTDRTVPSPQNKITTFSALGLIFVTLRLLDRIDWSWWLVLAPFWAPSSIMFVGLGLAALIKVRTE